MKVYIEPNDWWIGYYRGDTHHYVCPLPTVVIRWRRRHYMVWNNGYRARCHCEATKTHPIEEGIVYFAEPKR